METDQPEKYVELSSDKNISLKKFIFGLSRTFDWGKKLRWYMQKENSDLVELPIISRNNLQFNDMSFLKYSSSGNTDILQEYFFPMEKLSTFVDKLREVVEKNN